MSRLIRRPSPRLLASLLLAAGFAATLSACGGSRGPGLGERVVPLGQPVPKGGGSYRVGEPYQINGVWYRPGENRGYDKVGVASWYGELFHGRRTANGEIYDMERLSAASTTLPMPVYAKVTNLANGRSLVLRVNDRGPYRSNRIMDVSRRAAELLGFRERGTTQVRVQYLRPAPLDGDDSFERRYAESQPWTRVASRTEFHALDPMAVGSLGAGALRRRQDQVLGPADGPASEGTSLAEEEDRQARSSPRRAQGPSSPKSAIPVRTVSIDPPALSVPEQGAILIQAGSFRSRDNAERAKSMLANIARVDVAPVDSGSGPVYRVRVGPFANRDAAEAALAGITEAGYAGARIITN